MNIHEYQAKALLNKYGVPVPKGYTAQSIEEVKSALTKLNESDKIVVKAQIHAGGRGKGSFCTGYEGGVKVVDNHPAAVKASQNMLGNNLITAQTGPNGRKVQTLYITEACDISHEYYLAIVLDRETAQSVIIASTEGGMDIEAVAEETPDKIVRIPVSPATGLRPHHCRRISYELGLEGTQIKQCANLLSGLYKLFWEKNMKILK